MSLRHKVDLKTVVEVNRIIEQLSKIPESLNEWDNHFVQYHKDKLDKHGSEFTISDLELIKLRFMHRVYLDPSWNTSPELEADIIAKETKKLRLEDRIRKAKRARNRKRTRGVQKLNFPKWNQPAAPSPDPNALEHAPTKLWEAVLPKKSGS
jgi:hypothetical protein